MTKVNIFLFILFFLCCASSCNKDTDRELECTIEIQNKDLREAITEYQDFLLKDNKKLIEHGDSFYVGVFSKDINDSIYRCVISPVYSISDIRYLEPFILCKVNGHHVILSYTKSYNPYPFKLCKRTETAYQKYSQLLFPKEYEERKKKKNLPVMIYEPENCYLTFWGDSLIDKTLKRGSPYDRIPVKLNGKEVYL